MLEALYLTIIWTIGLLYISILSFWGNPGRFEKTLRLMILGILILFTIFWKMEG